MRLTWLWAVPLGLLVSAAVMTAGPYRELSTFGPLFDEAPARSIVEAAERVARGGSRLRALYAAHQRWDLLFALANAGVLGFPIVVFGTRLRVPAVLMGTLLGLVVAFVAADVLENWLVLRAVGSGNAAGIVAAAPFTRAKFALFLGGAAGATILSLVWSVRTLIARVSGRRRARICPLDSASFRADRGVGE